jgi:hypothetical protein
VEYGKRPKISHKKHAIAANGATMVRMPSQIAYNSSKKILWTSLHKLHMSAVILGVS